MSTTVTYKGNTIATVNNNTKTLKTAGTIMEDDITLVDVSSGGGGTVTWDETADQDITIISDNPNYFVINNYTVPLQADETYRVTWGSGGTVYTCETSPDSTGTAYDGYFFGNSGIAGGTDTGEPFLIYRDRADRLVGIANQSAGTIHIVIERQVSGGGSSTLVSKTITANGVYDPADDSADGYSEVTVALPAGTEGTPTASKGAVSNHSISVTPSVTNSGGVISGGTHAGTPVTVSASELVSGSETKTANGTYDVTNLASLIVNVSGGGGLALLQTTSLGSLSTSSTSAIDTGKTVSLAQSTGWQNYDLLIVDISVNTATNGRHTSTVSFVILTGTSNVSTKNTYTVGSNKWSSKLSSNGTGSTRQATTAYGIYVNSASASSNTLTLTVYYRYNSNTSGTINGTYTARVYGVKLYDLIGG